MGNLHAGCFLRCPDRVRELRDSFAADIWKELHIEGAMIFTQTEVPIAVFVLVLMFLIVFVRNNRLALNIIYCIAVTGGSLWFFPHCFMCTVFFLLFGG